jgi:hypothetical protein
MAWSKAVRKAQSSYWDKRLSTTNQADIWKAIRRVAAHKKPIPPLLGCTDFEGKCNLLRTAISPPIPASPNPIPPLKPPLEDLTTMESLFTSVEVSQILKNCKDGTAPGHDGVSYKYIARLHQRLPTILPLLYNSIIAYNTYPSEWKRAICVITPKKGKATYLSPHHTDPYPSYLV